MLTSPRDILLAAVSYDELVPLFASTPARLGGLSWNTNDIGTAMAVCGMTMIPIQMTIYSFLESRVSLVRVFQISAFGLALAALAMPFSHLLQDNHAAIRLVLTNTTTSTLVMAEHIVSSWSLWAYLLTTMLIFRVCMVAITIC